MKTSKVKGGSYSGIKGLKYSKIKSDATNSSSQKAKERDLNFLII